MLVYRRYSQKLTFPSIAGTHPDVADEAFLDEIMKSNHLVQNRSCQRHAPIVVRCSTHHLLNISVWHQAVAYSSGHHNVSMQIIKVVNARSRTLQNIDVVKLEPLQAVTNAGKDGLIPQSSE